MKNVCSGLTRMYQKIFELWSAITWSEYLRLRYLKCQLKSLGGKLLMIYRSIVIRLGRGL